VHSSAGPTVSDLIQIGSPGIIRPPADRRQYDAWLEAMYPYRKSALGLDLDGSASSQSTNSWPTPGANSVDTTPFCSGRPILVSDSTNGSGMTVWENIFGTYNPWPWAPVRMPGADQFLHVVADCATAQLAVYCDGLTGQTFSTCLLPSGSSKGPGKGLAAPRFLPK